MVRRIVILLHLILLSACKFMPTHRTPFSCWYGNYEEYDFKLSLNRSQLTLFNLNINQTDSYEIHIRNDSSFIKEDDGEIYVVLNDNETLRILGTSKLKKKDVPVFTLIKFKRCEC
jgi:hypothetical protein